jgi:HAUS augmin-like complex subunit 6 N-terminus
MHLESGYECVYSSLVLLGAASPRVAKLYQDVVFSSSMFNKPNAKGMEAVLHFLLIRLKDQEQFKRVRSVLRFAWSEMDLRSGMRANSWESTRRT